MRFTLLFFLVPACTLTLAAQTPIERFREFRATMPPEMVMRDAARLDPEHVRVEIDNESTRVLRITLEPSRQVPDHEDRAGVLVCLTECRLRLVSAAGPQEVRLRAGQAQWMKADQRRMQNIGSGVAELLYIESKKPQE
jgi:hypothetical protein